MRWMLLYRMSRPAATTTIGEIFLVYFFFLSSYFYARFLIALQIQETPGTAQRIKNRSFTAVPLISILVHCICLYPSCKSFLHIN
jgi:hypothetical protein